ncbi:MAG: MoaD/ThiS family protein [Chloroflexota bacterium]
MNSRTSGGRIGPENMFSGAEPAPDAQLAKTSEVTLEFHGFLADRLSELGRRHGTRLFVSVPLAAPQSAGRVLAALADCDARYRLVFDAEAQNLPEHVEVVLNDRVLDLQGGLAAVVKPGDVLTFIPAHAGGATHR